MNLVFNILAQTVLNETLTAQNRIIIPFRPSIRSYLKTAIS